MDNMYTECWAAIRRGMDESYLDYGSMDPLKEFSKLKVEKADSASRAKGLTVHPAERYARVAVKEIPIAEGR